jgi:hypothetical protein
MIASDERGHHEEVWLLLPWLANGRLPATERDLAEEHVRYCNECERELRLQRLLCSAFTEPDRVTYAPGPSFRKLMDRIDLDADTSLDKDATERKAPARVKQAAGRSWSARLGSVSLWRPPGVAWAASFLLLFGITGMLATASYRWSEPLYHTHTENPAVTPNVLHIALDRSLTLADVEELLRSSGARIVEGPGSTGIRILGVTPVGVMTGQTPQASANRQLRALSARLRSDSRVLWVQPLAEETTPADERAPATQEH